MISRVDSHLEELQRDHARWSSDHGHWTKDMRIWRIEHSQALEAAANIEVLVARFDELVPPHLRDVMLHDEETRLHARELSGAAPGSKHPGEEMHKCGAAEHAREAETHEELRQLHLQILAEVEQLKAAFPASPARRLR